MREKQRLLPVMFDGRRTEPATRLQGPRKTVDNSPGPGAPVPRRPAGPELGRPSHCHKYRSEKDVEPGAVRPLRCPRTPTEGLAPPANETGVKLISE